ncbi:hypothetical protein D3C80_1594610 [compost metagenome]
MNGTGNDKLFAFGSTCCQNSCFCEGGSAVVHTGVGHLHAGKLTDVGLKLENRLQLALADLRLIRGISRIELRTGNHMVDNNRYMVIIDAGPEEAGVGIEIGIFVGQLLHMAEQRVFIQRLRHRHCALVTDGLRNIDKQLFHGLNSDGFHHLLAILLSHGQIAVLHYGFTPCVFL